MTRFKRSMVTLLLAVAVVCSAITAAGANEVAGDAQSPARENPRSYAVGRPLRGPRVESVLTNPRAAVTSPRRGTGWLVHYGTEGDACTREDATSGLRLMCVAP